MQFYWRIIFLMSLCMSVGACMTLPSYSDPLIDAADDSEIAIIANLCFFGFGCIDRIRDAYGKDIPGFSSEPDPFTTENKKFSSFDYRPVNTISGTNITLNYRSCFWFQSCNSQIGSFICS